MTTSEIADKLVELCRKGENKKAQDMLYAKDIVSVEARDMPNMPREMKGIDAINKKSEWWVTNNTIHSANVAGPYVAVDKFAVQFDYDVTFKPTNKRSKMTEVGVYTVKNGKIVHEEFLYLA